MRPLTFLAIPSVLAGCVLPTSSASPVLPETSAEPAIAVRHEALDADYLLPGAALVHDGTAHLWVVAFDDGEPPTVRHLVADEVGTWTATDATLTAMNADAIGLNEIGPIPSSVLVEADGRWTMYGGGRLPGDRAVIWRATAPGPDGPWQMHPDPVLEPSADGWDDHIVDHPSVVAVEDGYLMTYGGESRTARNRGRIGAAVSPDGITWERVHITLPDADDEAAAGPAACGIEARTMFEPELVDMGDGYRLHFGAMRTEPVDEMVIGELWSGDGRTWRCAADGPVVVPGDLVPDAGLHSYLAVRGGSDALLVEVLGPDTPSSDVWLVHP